MTSLREPVLPAFEGPCLTNVVRALHPGPAGVAGQPGAAGQAGVAGSAGGLGLAEAVSSARQVVLLVLDGLGWEQLEERRALAPTLSSGIGGPITSVAPSTTAVALTSLTTGLPPAAHGMVGYRVLTPEGILNTLTWRLESGDARQRLPARHFQPFPPFPSVDAPVPVVSRTDYGPTGFTAAHLGDAVLRGWHTASGLVVEVQRVLGDGAPFVYAYYDGIDRVSHARGLGDHFAGELRATDRLVADLLAALPAGAALVVTADHGQVEVGQSIEVLGPELMDMVVLLSGEGRFRWLHGVEGAAPDLAETAQGCYGDVAWVRTREEVIEGGWLGGEPVPAVADRLGDVALVPFEPTAFLDPADAGEQRLVGRHGSLTSAEMLVPLLSWPVGI